MNVTEVIEKNSVNYQHAHDRIGYNIGTSQTAWQASCAASKNGTSYTNTSAEAGKTYYYTVIALHGKSSANSAYSETKARTCDLARPEISVSLNSSGKPVVSWSTVNGAAKYTVYMYDPQGDLVKSCTTANIRLTFTSAAAGFAIQSQ